MKRFVVGIVLVVLSCTWAAAESSVWKAQKGNSVLYLGGTCHILRESDYPLPPEFEKAYKASDVVVFETDLEQMNAPASQQKLLSKVVYVDGSTIQNHLSPRAYQALKAYCEANDIPLTALSQLKPSMLMVTVAVMELRKLGVTQQGVDIFFYRLAQKERKRVAALETVEQQIDYIATMADGNEDDFVIHSIQEMKDLDQNFDQMAGAWRKGDAEKMNELLNADMKSDEPKLYRKLIVDRNRAWLPVIEAYRKTPQIRFVLVGVAHLVGPDGIIESLKKQGYEVKRL